MGDGVDMFEDIDAGTPEWDAAMDAMIKADEDTMRVAYFGDDGEATFTLTIELGNDGMCSFAHIGEALYKLAHNFESEHANAATADAYDRSGKVRDTNGNTVGSWEIA
jgi:hypothetical protein